jgi:S1-C subfamily serine protease
MSDMLKRYRWWMVLMVVLLAGGSLSSGLRSALAQSTQLSDDAYTRAELATVQIYILDPKGKPLGTCTGTYQTADGIILTNFHCVGHTDLYGEDDSGLGLKNGDFYNPKGLVVIAPTKSDKEVPKPTYVAQVLASNPNLDIAVVKIVGMLKDGQKLPTNLPIVPIKRADSEKVKVRDFVGVLGYPGVGGPLLTYTSGEVAGFEDQNEDDAIDSFKTTANINPGNSGGLAVNGKGEQIGIPTYGVSEGASKIDRIKMVNVAIPYINQAIKGGGSPVTMDTPSTPTDPVTPPVGNDPAPTPNGDGVVLTGKIVDANTKRGVAGALLIILQPGVPFEEFQSSGFDENLVATVGTADRNGKYQTSPALERGQTYTVVIGAKGYQPRVFEDGLEITADDADVTTMEDITIQKQ